MSVAKIAVHLLYLLSLAWIMHNFLIYQLGADPVETLLQWSGFSALIILGVVSLLNFIKRFRPQRHLQRLIKIGGWYALIYAIIHLGIYLYLDLSFDMVEFLKEISEKRYLYLGMGSLVVMLVMGIIHEFKKGALRLRPLFYLAPFLGALHYFFIQKSPTPLSITILGIGSALLLIRLAFFLKMKK